MVKNTEDKRKKYLNILLACLCCVLWGSAFPVLKLSFSELQIGTSDVYSKMVFAGMRFLIAAILICIYFIFTNKELPKVLKKQLPSLLLLGVFNTTLQYYFFYNGLANSTGIKGAVLSSSGTFFIIIFAHFVYKDDKLSIRKILGMIAGLVGIFAINWTKVGSDNVSLSFSFKGEGYLLIAGVVSAIATIYGKNIAQSIKPIVMNVYQFFFGSIILIVFGLIGANGYHLKFTPFALVLLIYSAVLSAVAFCIWYALLKNNKASTIAIYKFLIPIVGSTLSIIFLPNEYFNIYIIIGLILASFGIYLVNSKKNND